MELWPPMTRSTRVRDSRGEPTAELPGWAGSQHTVVLTATRHPCVSIPGLFIASAAPRYVIYRAARRGAPRRATNNSSDRSVPPPERMATESTELRERGAERRNSPLGTTELRTRISSGPAERLSPLPPAPRMENQVTSKRDDLPVDHLFDPTTVEREREHANANTDCSVIPCLAGRIEIPRVTRASESLGLSKSKGGRRAGRRAATDLRRFRLKSLAIWRES